MIGAAIPGAPTGPAEAAGSDDKLRASRNP
jgi:hypothetical protein